MDKAALQLRRTILCECDLLHVFLPRFCYHDHLSIAGNCRMCVVETNMSAKPVVACATVFSDKLEVLTGSYLVKNAREGVLEFLLINHPLDCPIVIKEENVIYRIRVLFLVAIAAVFPRQKDLWKISILVH